MKDISLGQFFPGNSFLHRLDPRTKLLGLIVFIVFIFLTVNIYSALFVLAVSLIAVLMTKIPLKIYLKGLKAIWFIVILSAVLNMFYVKGSEDTLLLSVWKIEIYREGVVRSALIALRIICMILCSSVLSFTTSPTKLTDAIEALLSPLKIFKVRVNDLAMMMSIALRFVPTLLEETEKIMNAQKARGADMESGGMIKKVKALIPVLVPLFVSSYRRAYELAMAMDCRCYTGDNNRTRMNSLRYSLRDFAAAFLTLIVCGAVPCANFFL
ncbi:MAG: energy-coupling factor transporter transmembrane protein EcfT [Oscillospiraceae bacterium]|jgi:energy-coupling factor transport system permease protein|nr:energy-coupling factor transporter transmembrane protein EcfT [Oscillospiraceae bacterium]